MALVLGVATENAILNNWLGAVAPTVPATYYAAAYTAAPTGIGAGGGGTEVTTAGGTLYARVAVTNNTTNFPSSTADSKTNANAITWPAAGANWGTVVAIGLFDAATSGNFIMGWTLDSPRVITAGMTFQIAAGFLTLVAAGA